MSETPKKFTAAIKRHLGFRAVWPPTSLWGIGDYVVRDEGYYRKIGNIKEDFDIDYNSAQGPSLEINFQTSKVYVRRFEAGFKVSEFSNNLEAQAQIELDFRGEHSFAMYSTRAPSFTMRAKQRLGKIVARKAPSWKHSKWFIITEVYRADSFVLLANSKNQKKVMIGGDVKAINSFFHGNISPSLQISSLADMELKIMGDQTGPIVVELIKVKSNGDIDFA